MGFVFRRTKMIRQILPTAAGIPQDQKQKKSEFHPGSTHGLIVP
jgi:hypothetical protein